MPIRPHETKLQSNKRVVGVIPWRYGNRFSLLNDGTRFFPRMFEAIEGARQYVLLEMYLVESGALTDRLIEVLLRAAARGVRTAVLLDGFGSTGLRIADRRRLLAADVDLRFHNVPGWGKRLANFLRDHRKLLVIDGRVAFTGGAGFTDEFSDGGRFTVPWREIMVEIHGPVVADWQRLFLETWRKSGGEFASSELHEQTSNAEGAAGRVAFSEGWHRSDLADSVVRRIDSAHERAWVMSPYFVPSRRFRKALRRAVRRGVDVRLLVSGPLTDHPAVRHAARRFFGKLLYNGVRIFEYQPRVLHAKMVICDGWVSIGSSNLDRWSFKWNLEANQEIEHHSFANQATATFEEDCAASLELDNRTWLQRGWTERLREYIAGALDRALERWRRPS